MSLILAWLSQIQIEIGKHKLHKMHKLHKLCKMYTTRLRCAKTTRLRYASTSCTSCTTQPGWDVHICANTTKLRYASTSCTSCATQPRGDVQTQPQSIQVRSGASKMDWQLYIWHLTVLSTRVKALKMEKNITCNNMKITNRRKNGGNRGKHYMPRMTIINRRK